MSVSPPDISGALCTTTADPFIAPQASNLVLLIDDDEFVADIVERILLRVGKRVLRARNGREGAQLFKAHQLNLAVIMLDCGLPDISGVSLCRTFRQTAPDLPVILTSGFELGADGERVLHGPTVFLAKPFFASQVEELVAELCLAAK